MRERQVLSEPARSFDEGNAISIMLLHPGRDSEYVGIEDDVLRRKADSIHQNVVSARGDRFFLFRRVGLARFVESHDDHSSAMPPHEFGVPDKRVLRSEERRV